MSTPYEIPTELRDFAARSVDQARKAFEGFMEVAQKAAGTVDGAAQDAARRAPSKSARISLDLPSKRQRGLRPRPKDGPSQGPAGGACSSKRILEGELNALQGQAKQLGALIQKNAPPASK